ncbi:hypothetical protein GCM10011511_54010 [Puia dinghuensis]|uniref:Histidine kinase domain-containing protein n=2 Tax=Puia dinghuensis TaxID=1792502 RepID=A0A8J2UJ24_9BACT|nr:hypothetical protein GCM10011511_54010 [Puia dinghuensis]
MAFGQEIKFLDITKLDPSSGLSSSNVRSIIQDRYGFMWFATQEGLDRFDGTSFLHFNPGAQDSRRIIEGSDVFDLSPDSSGQCIWALTAYGGLNRICLETCTVLGRYPLSPGIPGKANLWSKCMQVTGNRVFVGTDEGLLLDFDKRTAHAKMLLNLSTRPGRKGPIDKIWLDSKGQLWLFISGAGISVIDTVGFRERAFLSLQALGLPSSDGFQFTGYTLLKDQLFIGSTSGLAIVSPNDLSVITKTVRALPPDLITGEIRALSAGGNRLLICGRQSFVLMDPDTQTSHRILLSRNVEDKDWVSLANCLYQSGESIWVGSQYGVGCIRNIHTAFTGYYSSMDGNGVKINHGTTLCKIDDSISVVCADDGIYRVNEASGFITRIGSSPDFFYEAFRAPGNYFIASSIHNGLQLYDLSGHSRSLLKVFPELAPIRGDLLIGDARLNDSVIFLASQNQRGIYIWNTVEHTVQTANTESGPFRLKSNVINRLYFDSRRQLWIVGDNSISICHPFFGSIRHLDLLNPVNHRPLSINMDICQVGSSYYITSYGTGIVRLDSSYHIARIYGLGEGVNNLGLYKIFPVNDSMVMASSNNGLSLLQPGSNRIINYFGEDGLQSDNFEEASGASYKDFLLFGGIRGYTRINRKALLAAAEDPMLYFSSVEMQYENSVADTFNIRLKQLVVPHSVLQVSIGYSALNYLRPKRLVFRYRIKELNEAWISNGNRRSVLLLGLSPGSYTLQLQAANEGFPFNEANTLELTLKYLPKWYQTIWFKLAIGLLLAGILYSFFLMRLNQLKRQQQIRREIAGDLHDDLGATLNSIKLLTHIAQRSIPGQQQLEQIEASVSTAIAGLRDVLWVLDDSGDTFYHLQERIKRFTHPLALENNIRMEWLLDEELSSRRMSKKEKKNLLLIAKEAFNNALKHAACTSITISLSVVHDKPCLAIADNGKGFNTSALSEGYGLKNIRYRAEQIGYIANIISAQGEGTTVTVIHR